MGSPLDDRLLEACKAGDLLAVSDAIRAGADPHCYGDAPLMRAAVHGHYAVVQHLWLHTEPPRHFNVGHGTLRRCAEKGHTAIATFLVPYATRKELGQAIAAALRKEQYDTALALAAHLPLPPDSDDGIA
jgi:ankyrin repeat protein